VAKSNFLTDSFSTTGGLAAVAYGSSSFFPAVADQIKRGSKTKALDSQRPSQVFLDFVGTKNFVLDVFKSVIQSEYDSEGIITDFIDLYASDVNVFSTELLETFLFSIDEYSSYSISPSTIIFDSIEKTIYKFNASSDLEIDSAILSSKIEEEFIKFGYVGEDVSNVLVLVINNPNTKITSAPPDDLIQLDIQGVSTKDSRGVDRVYGTISPVDYYNGIAYKNEGSSIKKSIIQGYVGYPLVSLLGESLLNPDGYENVDLNYLGSSALSNLSDDFNVFPTQQAIYNIDLTTIDLGTN
jgi:hypothetical protein